jgi:hypothetical protein
MVMIDYKFIYMFVKHLIQYLSGFSGSQYVSMMLRYCMPTNAPYMLGHIVDHRCDNYLIESFIVHSLYVGIIEHGCRVMMRDLPRVMFLMHS